MIPVRPDWQQIVNDLYVRFGSYKRLQNALSKQSEGLYPDHSTLSHLRNRGRPMWELGAALMNLHEEHK